MQNKMPKGYMNTYLNSLAGLEDLFGDVKVANSLPYNIIQLDDGDYIVELACAGFAEGNLAVTLEKDKLTVSGMKCLSESESGKYVHQGISKKDFVSPFKIFSDAKIVYAKLKDGILSIKIHKLIPEVDKPRVITIN